MTKQQIKFDNEAGYIWECNIAIFKCYSPMRLGKNVYRYLWTFNKSSLGGDVTNAKFFDIPGFLKIIRQPYKTHTSSIFGTSGKRYASCKPLLLGLNEYDDGI